jgi:hypothetical protein
VFALQAFFSFPSIVDYVVSGQIDQCISIYQILPVVKMLVEAGLSYRFMIQFLQRISSGAHVQDKEHFMNLQQLFNTRQSRRSALRKFSTLARAGLALNAGTFAPSSIELSMTESRINPIKHVLVACQENRTFDEYYGYYPRAGSFGIPKGYYQLKRI